MPIARHRQVALSATPYYHNFEWVSLLLVHSDRRNIGEMSGLTGNNELTSPRIDVLSSDAVEAYMLEMINSIENANQPNIIVAQISNNSSKRKYVVGDCSGINNSEGFTTENSRFIIEPNLAASYLNRVAKKELHLSSDVKISVEPKHGKIDIGQDDKGRAIYYYHPDKGFFGKDEARFVVSSGNVEVEVRYYFHVVNHPIGNLTDQELCKNKTLWRISENMPNPLGDNTWLLGYETKTTRN